MAEADSELLDDKVLSCYVYWTHPVYFLRPNRASFTLYLNFTDVIGSFKEAARSRIPCEAADRRAARKPAESGGARFSKKYTSNRLNIFTGWKSSRIA
jgi:hypothetical protein